MKLLTKEEQEQAVQIIKNLTQDSVQDFYYESAKAFLKSLKPKVYMCQIDEDKHIYFLNANRNWDLLFESAMFFDSIKMQGRCWIVKIKTKAVNTSS